MSTDDAYREGWAACEESKPISSCPYKGQEAKDWRIGWNEAKRYRDMCVRACNLQGELP